MCRQPHADPNRALRHAMPGPAPGSTAHCAPLMRRASPSLVAVSTSPLHRAVTSRCRLCRASPGHRAQRNATRQLLPGAPPPTPRLHAAATPSSASPSRSPIKGIVGKPLAVPPPQTRAPA
ncbi:hypothetical protein U9M48_028677 [Paspalum notatum var. saurae]|uniref:Uncharacterized protein n=1 Tax=Paspalum notatum var. saurae TaxID=547442 RepID=A0AAQ3TW03_PASNO